MIYHVKSLKYITPVIIFGLTCVLLKSSVTINVSWTTVLCVISLALIFIYWHKGRSVYMLRVNARNFESENPFRGKTGPGYLSEQRESEVTKAVADSVLYDAYSTRSLANFSVIKHNSECLFAKKSKLWGSPDYDDSLSLVENIWRLAPTFYKFTLTFQELGLDGFVIELPGKPYGENIQIFGQAVRSVLLTLYHSDIWRQQKIHGTFNEAASRTLSSRILDTSRWTRRNWVFEFNNVTFFVTTFAPFYPKSNSRYAFGCENGYILFQPELSFAIHDIPTDASVTSGAQPTTVKDKIRTAFNDAGRGYETLQKHKQAMVFEIVKPLNPSDECPSWWLLDDTK